MVGYANDFLSLGVKGGGRELPFSAVIFTEDFNSDKANSELKNVKKIVVVFVHVMMDRNVCEKIFQLLPQAYVCFQRLLDPGLWLSIL